MKKFLIIAALAVGAYALLGSKKTDDQAPTAPATDTDRGLEDYIVIEQDTNSVFAIKNGKRWYVTSAKAGEDFYNAYGLNLDYKPNALMAYSSAELASYPIGGALLENLEFQQ